ncbi:MAG: YqgE/AlgH family protein [Verrucomicrobiota bacterium]|nr:YqgE/AlgH family protein [Verrucomicrobiota bacterium]
MGTTFKSLKGQLLLDSGQLRGSFFNRSVVLICHHDEEGAFGLVLNNESEATLGEVIPEEAPESLKENAIFLGGPVQTNTLSYLHTSEYLLSGNVLPNLSIGHSMEGLNDLGGAYSTTQKIRLFAGYSGWSAGQLETEMERKAWLTHPATLDLVFTAHPTKLWQTVLHEMGWRYKLLATAPDDLSSN